MLYNVISKNIFWSECLFVGVGVSMVKVSGPIMLAQYFKKKRLYVEFISQMGTGLGIIINHTYQEKKLKLFTLPNPLTAFSNI